MRAIRLFPAAALVVTAALPAQAQWRDWSLEVRPFAGVFVPVGAQRSDFKAATTLGAQTAVELGRNVHALAGVGWTHGHNKLYVDDVTHIWQYDAGAEFNLNREIGDGIMLRPFVGAGAGGRTYDYKAGGVGTNSCLAGYGTLGSEIQDGVIAFRAEARNYLSCYESPISGTKRTRHDLGLSIGLAYHLR
jgi:hypothetical protein